MTTFRIVYEKLDGGVAVVCPPPVEKRAKIEGEDGPRPMSDAEYVAFLNDKGDIPHGAEFKTVTVGDLPQDRYFRNAWVKCPINGAKVDMDRAREVHKNTMRLRRAPLLAALDVDQLRGKDVATQKQVLRDVTSHPGIAAAATPEALKAVWPAALGPRE